MKYRSKKQKLVAGRYEEDSEYAYAKQYEDGTLCFHRYWATGEIMESVLVGVRGKQKIVR